MATASQPLRAPQRRQNGAQRGRFTAIVTDVWCPHCEALPGEPCITPTERVYAPRVHRDRRDRFNAQNTPAPVLLEEARAAAHRKDAA